MISVDLDFDELLEQVKMSDLPDGQKEVALLIGLDNYKKLIKEYGGVTIYIPKSDGFELAYRNIQIRNEFNGYNYRELAKKYGLSEVRVRSIVNDIVTTIRNKPLDGQMRLFK